MKTILITGTNGLIAGILLKHFGINAIGFDKGDSLPSKEEAKNIKLVIHCASMCVVRDIIKNPKLMMDNIKITYQVMEFARNNNVKKVVLFSSSRVNCKEKNPYTVSKEFLENIAEGYRQAYGIDYIIIRPETVWGHNEKNRRAISTWIDNTLYEKPVIIYGDKEKELPPITAKEFVSLLLPIINNFDKNKGRTFSIAGKPKKVIEIISEIEQVTRKKANIIYKPAETAQPQRCTTADFTGKQSFIEQLKQELNSN